MLTQEELKLKLHYDESTGVFTRLASKKGVKVGDIAGYLRPDGYIEISINNKSYLAHRLAWLYVTGEFPINHLDHLSGIKNDNKWLNLREATQAQNLQNQTKPRSDNKSGYLGVYFHNHAGKFQAQIQLNGKRTHLGLFDTAALASQAYLSKKREIHEFCTI